MKTKAYLILFVMGVQCLLAQQTKEKFVIEQEYLKYLPEGYDADDEKKWPLMVFLHGSGERGTDIEKVKVHGPPMLVEKGKKFPFIILSPQAKTGWDEDMLYQMILDFVSKNRVDTNRIYLTGLSMGGYGTWKLAQKHPEMFAAIVPICGGGDSKKAWKLRHTPVWCFHGKLDGVVPLSESETMINALRPLNSNVKFTVYPETYHDSWIQAYNDPELYKWLLKQEKFKHKAVKLPLTTLEKYVGNYDFKMNGFEGICTVSLKKGQLHIKMGDNIIPLTPSSNDTFFVDKNQPVEFKFVKNKADVVEKIWLYTDEILAIPKIKD